MARPLRIEYNGAVYHVTSRGNARSEIFVDDLDRKVFLKLIEEVVNLYNWLCHAYCLMGNHYHLLIETPGANLSTGMRQVNGIYTQAYNRRHGKEGHLFQGRYKAIVVEKEAYLLELCRYVVLNPVRAGLVTKPEDWPWSSYKFTAEMAVGPQRPLLTIDWILGQFGSARVEAQGRYREFVMAGRGVNSPWEKLHGQIFLGREGFIENLRGKVDKSWEIEEVPRVQRYAGRPLLSEIFEEGSGEDKVRRRRDIWRAHVEHGYLLKEIANYLGVHYTTVSRVLKEMVSLGVEREGHDKGY